MLSRLSVSREGASALLAVLLLAFFLPIDVLAQNDSTTPKYDVFVGYQWLHPGGTVPSPFGTPANPIPLKVPDMAKGFGASFTYNFDNYWGAEADLGTNWGNSNNETTLSVGPRFMLRQDDANYFLHALVSYNRLGVNGLDSSNQIGAVMGGGMDLRITRRFYWRVFEADYVGSYHHYTAYANVPSLGRPAFNGARLRGGLLINFGYEEAAAVGATVSVQPTQLMVGEPAMATATESNFNAKHQLTYDWASTCGKITGTGTTASIDTNGASGGTCTVTVHVKDPKAKKNNLADASTTFTVKEPPKNPPTASCSASPSSAQIGATVSINCTCTSPDGVPVTVSNFSATSGTISGSGNSAALNTAGAQAGTVTVSASCSDQRGLSTQATTSVSLENPPPPQVSPEIKRLEARLSLHGVYFPTAQPAVAHPNGGLVLSQQRTLETLASDFKQYLESKPDAHLILQGHADKRGSAAYNQALSERRVNSTKNFLVQHGVPEANIETKAFGSEQNLTADQVKASVEQDTELTAGERQRILSHARTIILASNRRVDITLNTTGQESVRQFPFNAEDSLTLIGGREKPAAKTAKPKTRRRTRKK